MVLPLFHIDYKNNHTPPLFCCLDFAWLLQLTCHVAIFFLLLHSVDLKSNFTQWSRISHSFVYEECRFCFLIFFCFYGSEFPWYTYLAFQLFIRLGRGAVEQCNSNFPFPERDSALKKKKSKRGSRTGLMPTPSHACPYLPRLRADHQHGPGVRLALSLC